MLAVLSKSVLFTLRNKVRIEAGMHTNLSASDLHLAAPKFINVFLSTAYLSPPFFVLQDMYRVDPALVSHSDCVDAADMQEYPFATLTT